MGKRQEQEVLADVVGTWLFAMLESLSGYEDRVILTK